MWQVFIKSKLATVALFGVLIFVMVLTARILIQKRIVDREISKLETQISKVKKDNEQLSSLVKYFDTPEYQEKQAREKLNLKKDGEIVVALPQSDISGAADQQVQTKQASNFQRWVDYFFTHAE